MSHQIVVDKAIVLVDGGYFDNLNRVTRGEFDADIDIHALSHQLCAEFDVRLLRTKFYHAMPYQDDNPSENQRQYYADRKGFYDAIDNKDNHQFVQRGEVQKHTERCDNCNHTAVNYSQKGVDVGIAVDLVDMAYQKAADAFILLSGDQDLTHAVEAAKDAYANVYLAFAHNPKYRIHVSDRLSTEADSVVRLTPDTLQQSLRDDS